MFNIDEFKVELINAEEVKEFVKNHGKFASICYNSNEKYAEAIGRDCLKSGHMSGSRGDYFKFKLTNVPRDMIDQLIRSEEGCYKNVQSFRYVNKDGFDIYSTPEVEKDEELNKIFKDFEVLANDYYSEAVKRLNELGYKGDSLIDMLYDNTLTIEEILTPIDMLIDETVKPFKGIPYQFLMLVR